MKRANANNNHDALELLQHIAGLKTWLAPLECLRSSYSEVFIGKGAFKICSKFTGKPPCRSVTSINLQSNFIEITLHHGCSPVNLLHIFRTLFTKNIPGRLLLNMSTNDMFILFTACGMCNYVDDNKTLYAYERISYLIQEFSKNEFKRFHSWLLGIYMALNSCKCKFVTSISASMNI